MKHVQTGKIKSPFRNLIRTRSAQAMMMILQPGEKSDDKLSNEHPDSEQWLYVVSGKGAATGKKGDEQRRTSLVEGSLLLIEKGELHQVRNTGKAPLVTLNFYTPPAYDDDGEPF